MKNLILVWISLIALHACKNSQEKKEGLQEQPVIQEHTTTHDELEAGKDSNESYQIDCEEYWKSRFPGDSLRAHYIKEIISRHQLSQNNLNFLNALKSKKRDDLAFRKILSPIFRLSYTEIGIVCFPEYLQSDNKLIWVSKELDIIHQFKAKTKNTSDEYGELRYYYSLIDSLFNGRPKPKTYYYTTNRVGLTQILELASFEDECLEYFEYSIDTTDISLKDKVLFSSPNLIDLVFENNPKVDSLLQKEVGAHCFDCPNSNKHQKSFARIKGTENLYFAYADTFPLNNELDTPSRALIFINSKNEAIYLWYDEIDLFGCSCL